MTLKLPDLTAPPTGMCILMRAREDMNPEDRATLDAWLNDRDIAGWRIGRAVNIGSSTVNAHRGSYCACWGKS